MLNFKNKVVIISGAASGIGLMTAQRLASKGAIIALTDSNAVKANTAATEIINLDGKAIALHVDVSDYTSVKYAVEKVIQKYGHIDVLINCAGGASRRVFDRKEGFKDLPIEILDWGIDVNLKGPMYFAHAVIGFMMEKNKGVIINLGSVEGETGSKAAVDYSAAKKRCNVWAYQISCTVWCK